MGSGPPNRLLGVNQVHAGVDACVTHSCMSLFHEFGSDIRQMVKGQAPKFVFWIGERITNHQTPREGVSTLAR
jgi:hypothetical protein